MGLLYFEVMLLCSHSLTNVVCFPFSCIFNTNSLSRWHDSKIWNMGYCR